MVSESGRRYSSLESIRTLIGEQHPESRYLEFKRQLPGSQPEERREFLADISSFANADGGVIVYGVAEENGVAAGLEPLQITDPDSIVLMLQALIRDGIEPRISEVSIVSIADDESGYFVTIEIPRSWTRPHMVTYRSNSRFWVRDSAGKHPLDVGEIAGAFDQARNLAQRLRQFRSERISDVINDRGGVVLGAGAKIIVHIIPMLRFASGRVMSANQLNAQFRGVPPMMSGGWSTRYNFDGLLNYSTTGADNRYVTTVQFWTDGKVEAIENYLLRAERSDLYIPSERWEREIVQLCQRVFSSYLEAEITGQVAVTTTLLGVEGYRMGVDDGAFAGPDTRIDRTQLWLPEIIFQELNLSEVQIAHELRPSFDALWRAAGWAGSINYSTGRRWADAPNEDGDDGSRIIIA